VLTHPSNPGCATGQPRIKPVLTAIPSPRGIAIRRVGWFVCSSISWLAGSLPSSDWLKVGQVNLCRSRLLGVRLYFTANQSINPCRSVIFCDYIIHSDLRVSDFKVNSSLISN